MNVLLLICGCLGASAALFGPSRLSRRCPLCRGRGCVPCGWSGDDDDREVR